MTGSAQFLTVLSWCAWVLFVLCVAGVLIGAVQLIRGQQQAGLVWTLVACVIAGSASGIVGALA